MPLNHFPKDPMIAHGIFAVFGGVVHALVVDKGKMNFVDILVQTIIASFSGVVFGLVALNFFGDSYISLAITASGGYLGVEGLRWLVQTMQEILASRIKIK